MGDSGFLPFYGQEKSRSNVCSQLQSAGIEPSAQNMFD